MKKLNRRAVLELREVLGDILYWASDLVASLENANKAFNLVLDEDYFDAEESGVYVDKDKEEELDMVTGDLAWMLGGASLTWQDELETACGELFEETEED